MSAPLPITALGEPGLQRVLVTGASGFVGRALCAYLGGRGVDVTAITRDVRALPGATRVHAVGDFTAVSDWRGLMAGHDGLVHLAALTHDGTRGASAARFHTINVELSKRVVAAALAGGITRCVYLSSIKVNGESSLRDDGHLHAYTGDDPPAPADHYGRSKLAAEMALTALWPAAHGALTLLRPPLVFGAGQLGNMARLMALVARGLPLPFAAIDNRRSLIYVENLVAAIALALGITSAGVRCYTLADVEISTPALVRALAGGLGVQANLVALPAMYLRAFAHWPVIGSAVRRLTDSLVIDATAVRADLAWHAPIKFEAAVAATCAAWRQAQP